MKFTRLRLLGFKSFVEPTDIVIEPGMTGVVGPNGCGKSNLVEALRWVMGESSYKNMRGSGMDDVIFAGSGNRPARNTAEVTLVIDNSSRTAPAAFNDADILEVTRRIEREAGSAYKINGRDARARDVQLLFADASSGSRSPALVRQGQIGELINAKPESRRRLLEEAAGISGLYSRRHEAELRLRAAEQNMERLDDVIGQLESQFQGLKRQARHASRYKHLSAEIKKAQALLLHIKWTLICTAVSDNETALGQQTRLVGEAASQTAESSKERAIAAHALPALREREAQAAAALQRLRIARDTLDADLKRANDRINELAARRTQLASDLERERAMTGETAATLARLDDEEEELKAEAGNTGNAAEGAKKRLAEASAAAQVAEQRLSVLLDDVAQMRARRNELDRNAREAAGKLGRLEGQIADTARTIANLKAQDDAQARLERLADAANQAAAAIVQAEQEHTQASEAVASAREAEARLREPLHAAEREAQSLKTEIATLAKILNAAAGGAWTPVLDAISADKGYEAALGSALGDDLDAPTDQAAPAHWAGIVAFDGDAALPNGVEPLAARVRAPGELARRLAQIGVVEREDGRRLQAQLQPGQRLVSLQGDLWRWDGFVAAADAPTAAAQRLAQRNRMSELEAEIGAAQARVDAARSALEAASVDVKRCVELELTTRQAWREAQGLLGTTRDALAAAERQASEINARLAALSEAHDRLSANADEARAAQTLAADALAALGDGDMHEEQLVAMRGEVAAARSVQAEAQARFDGIRREEEMRARRLEAIARERASWSKRRDDAVAQISVLEERQAQTETEFDGLDGLPAQIELNRRGLAGEIEKAEAARSLAADAVAQGENVLAEADKRGRAADSALADAREERARIESRLEAARNRRSEIAHEISEQTGSNPAELLTIAGWPRDGELPDGGETEARLDQLNRERERIGAVNLRADEEMVEVETQLTNLKTEREDLDKAIRRLRQGIGQLNKEGRERMLTAFDTVNNHFQQLFTTLFNGGAAELQLTESDDPLEAGLEIIARPPGKKPQTLSLLSGGEQALTAMALIFAVFLTNPAPICVLDEVDAPLDDANVERFCTLVEEMTRATDTRFMVITHHPLTMSRMDRLFGVTMAERGVSQLVSVDLETAARFREAS